MKGWSVPEDQLWLSLDLGCACSITRGVDVEVTDVTARSATVQWNSVPNKCYIIILRVGVLGKCTEGSRHVHTANPEEIAFFETDGQLGVFTLPPGTLDRASGPYKVQVLVESGTPQRSHLTASRISPPFWTKPEPPSQVLGLSVTGKPAEHEIRIGWCPPLDDGSSPIAEYEVVARLLPSQGVDGICLVGSEGDVDQPLSLSHGSWCRAIRTVERSHSFDGLLPGTGPYWVEVRAMSAAGLVGPFAAIEASTLVAPPSEPELLHASLVQHSSSQEEQCGLHDAVQSLHGSDNDIDLVRLQFHAPVDDGGREIKSYLVYVMDEGSGLSHEDSADMSEAQCMCSETSSTRSTASTVLPQRRLLCTVPAARTAGLGRDSPRGSRACIVAVPPNGNYKFSLAASNGVHSSEPAEPTHSVAVPARVPSTPRAPPVALLVDGGQTVEVTWVGSLHGGGIPLTSYKLGILGPCTAGGQITTDVARGQLTVDIAVGVELPHCFQGCADTQVPVKAPSKKASYKARLDTETLEAGKQYCFVLAACNMLGMSGWSKASEPVWTPLIFCPIPAQPMAAPLIRGLAFKSNPASINLQPCAFELCPVAELMDEQQLTLPRIGSLQVPQLSRRE